jgi:MFS family permease
MYSSTILNPMLYEYYGFPPEKSSLFYSLECVSFIAAAPLAFELRSR